MRSPNSDLALKLKIRLKNLMRAFGKKIIPNFKNTPTK